MQTVELSNFCPQDFRDWIKDLGYCYGHRCYRYSVPRSWDAVLHRTDALHVSQDSREWGQASRENRVVFVHVV